MSHVCKPPVGLRPRYCWIDDDVLKARRKEIIEAMSRYTENNYIIPDKWINELILVTKLEEI